LSRLNVNKKVIKIAFLIRSLDCGGTERQLVSLAKALDKKGFDVTIITFYSGGVLEKELEDSRVRCVSLEKRGRWDVLGFLRRFAHQLRLLRPDVIHAYLDISNLLSVSAKLFLSRAVIIWGVRNSNMELRHYDWLWRLSFRLERLFSRFADCLIVNSNAGRAYLLKRGFPDEKIVVVHNGIDTELFRPDAGAGAKVRREWELPLDAILVGLVARLDPIKDHDTFLRAVSILQKEKPDVRFVCVGGGTENQTQRLYQLTEQLGLTNAINWVGMRSDMPAVYNAFDISVSSSQSEGFPNMIGEAMACAVPCVVTDAGDSALIVGDTGFVSATRNPEALAAALMSCLEENRKVLGMKARRRILERWSIEQLVEKTEKVMMAIMEK
jgi:glycosyltransferase involved in cell wall biosynthesis